MMYRRIRTADWDLPVLQTLLDGFTMLPDTKDQIVHEFLKGTTLYNAVLYDLNCEERLAESILWALTHKGNLVIELWGPQRHGKSTVGRLIARIIYALMQKVSPTGIQHWEDRVKYGHAFSDMTSEIMTMTNDWLNEGLTEQEILDNFKHYVFVFDEVLIEHEKDSIKAKNDLINLLNTVARAGIHFVFISPQRRGVGNYFSLWVVGYNEATCENLVFYFDANMQCKGYMITPQILETSKYTESKNTGILDRLKHGGRKPAKQKLVDQDEEVPVTPDDIEITTDFRPYAVERCKREFTDATYYRVLDLIMQGRNQNDTAQEVLGDPQFQMKVSRIMKELGLRRLGYWFEDWWCLSNDLTPNQNKNAPLPDAIKDGIPHSLKCYYTPRRTISLKSDDLFPEIDYARTNNTPVVLVFYNIYRRTITTREFASADAVPSTISIKFSAMKTKTPP